MIPSRSPSARSREKRWMTASGRGSFMSESSLVWYRTKKYDNRLSPLQHGHQRDVPQVGGYGECRDRGGRGDARGDALPLRRALGPLRGAVAPDDHPLEPALRPVELEGEEAEADDDGHDPGAGHTGAGHHDAGQHDQDP